MNPRTFSSGGNSTCAEIGDAGSCSRRNNWGEGISCGSIDLEDLAGCFPVDSSAKNEGARRWDQNHGHARVRGLRRDYFDANKRIVFPNNYNAETPIVEGVVDRPVNPSPSEQMWINMRRALLEEPSQPDESAVLEDFLAPEIDGRRNLTWNSENRAYCTNYQQVFPTNHLDSSATWTQRDNVDPTYADAFPVPDHGYNSGPGESYYASSPNFPDDNFAFFQDHAQSRAQIAAQMCSEEQWLRCPAQRCPIFDPSFDRTAAIAQLPCRDITSNLKFYYGAHLGYLNPAEYQQYAEHFLSNEKRKEKSRDAARCRRSRETDIFTELAMALPMATDQATHLDKASVMRLAIAYLKIRTVVKAIPVPLAKPEPSPEMDGLFLKALDGFMIVLSNEGDIVYMSENVSDYLGISQMDMMGQNVYEYSHPCDHEELRECLSAKPKEDDEKHTCNFFLRLKCTLTNKGRKVNLKSASYKVIHCIGHMVMNRDVCPQIHREDVDEDTSQDSDVFENGEASEKEAGGCLVVVGCPIPHPSNIEVPLGRQTFLSKHSLNMKFTYADEKLGEYLGWDTNELVGQSVFDFHHALDNSVLDKYFKSLFSKGQCETAAYRFLGKTGGYAWVVTQATLIHCAKQHKPLSVVCVNYILSGIECQNEVYSTRQLEARAVDASSPKQPVSSSVIPVAVLAAVAVLNKNNNNNNNENDSVSKNDSNNNEDRNDEETERLLPGANIAAIPIVPIPAAPQERPRPLVVTASLFRTPDKPTKELSVGKSTVDSNRDHFRKPVIVAKNITPQKPNLESRKEIFDRPESSSNNNFGFLRSQPGEHYFQGKPIVDYIPHQHHQRTRPQAVTRSLFAPAPIQEQSSRPPPQTATASIFAPRTEDMNKGFLTFSEDQPGLTMLKDEPEDLTHLAPTPGDVCVPLEDTPFLSHMLDEFILENDNYCPLLSPGLPNELRAPELGDSTLKDSDLSDSLRTSELGDSLADSDPFMYRDTSSPCSGTPNLLSPALSKSPESIDSLCSPTGSGGGFSDDEMLMLSINGVLADDELALRAPYIPMSDEDEALQLLISDDMVMWGPSQPPDRKAKWTSDTYESNVSSSLEQLLRTTPDAKKYNDHGGGLVSPTDTFGHVFKKKMKEDSWTMKTERSQKRLHATSNIESDNKRIKCEDTETNDALKKCRIDAGANMNLRTNNLDSREGSQLLQQLITQQSPKYRGGHTYRNEDDDGGGGAQNSPSLQQQSNSVLMNLLVSGCDDTIDARNIPPLLPHKISPLSLNVDNHMVSQVSPSASLQHLSPDTRKELINSLPRNKAAPTAQELIPMDFESFNFDDNPELLEDSDLLNVLANNYMA